VGVVNWQVNGRERERDLCASAEVGVV